MWCKRQILGVYQKDLVRTFASVAKNLSMDHVLIVHGFDGLDEITITDSTYVAELKDNTISEYEISPKILAYLLERYLKFQLPRPMTACN